MATEPEATVFVIDDERDMREALDALLRSSGLRVALFESVEAFVAGGCIGRPGCLLLDVRLRGRSGFDFQADLVARGVDTPVILMSGHADASTAGRAIDNGALEFLIKPVAPRDVIAAVKRGLARDEAQRAAR